MSAQDERTLPLLALRTGMVLPGSHVTLPIGRRASRALAATVRPDDRIVLGVQRDPKVVEPSLADLHTIGVTARVVQKNDRGRRGILLLVEGLERVRLTSLKSHEPYLRVGVTSVDEVDVASEEAEALAASLRDQLLEASAEDDRAFRGLLQETKSPGRLADRLAGAVDGPPELRVSVLLELNVPSRLRLAMELFSKARASAKMRETIDSEVRRNLGKQQKEAVLREQLKAIRKELGQDGGDGDVLHQKLESMELPEEVREQVDRELERLGSMNAQSPDAGLTRKYLELVAELPWNERAPASDDLNAVEAVLEDEHYGLSDVKRRILEHMAVLRLTGRARGTILCLVGPPGVGKTSLAQSVASATGRPLQRIALGGVRDEAEVRGHRRTYVGALPGRILSALKKAGVKNPVVVLDEVDKLGRGWQGDPEAALLEVLDPEQNHAFTDHYLEMPFDLSEVLFIATANDLSSISGPLRDRLEIIEVTGYTTEEKEAIASRHLLPAQLEKHGLPEGAITLADGTLDTVIREYTREAGVRQLAREIAKLCRSVALDWAKRLPADTTDPAPPEPVAVDRETVVRVLGRPKFFQEMAERARPPGVAAGLAWTPVGGTVLYVETTRMEGKGKVEITGQLGDVMNESARAALAYLRTHASGLGIDPRFLDETDLHIHVPAGGVPKDGPSAGVTMFTALASLLTGRRVRPDTAMTGEATLRGRVLPVGGIKSKVLAAHRAGFSRVLLPAQNERDYDEIPQSARDELEIVFVSSMEEVFSLALEDGPAVDSSSPTNATDPSGDLLV
ncbi:MAG: endopeptidase La [Sandaracinaceae bacterium]